MDDRLSNAARAVQSAAYAPYSSFKVGAALETEDGAIFVGCNVENASYGVSMCAERMALGAAISAGQRRFRRIVIVSDSDPPAAPCGACRQALIEFGADLIVDGIGPRKAERWMLKDLLPSSFSAEQLKTI